jgi:hypothetical protein
MVNPAAVSATVNVAVNAETDSAMQTRLEDLSKNNAVLGVPMHEKVVVDLPMVKCPAKTAGNRVNAWETQKLKI